MTAAPLTPADLDLRDFAYMPLDVVRLRDSELAVVCSGDAFRAAVLLWCAAWHQVPAASLPDDDRLLASLAGFGRDLKGWKAVRGEALHGFVLCDDGRLYHPVIAEKAIEAGVKRRQQQRRTAAATAAAAAKRRNGSSRKPQTETASESVTDTEMDTVPKHVAPSDTETKGIERNGIEEKAVVADATTAVARGAGKSIFADEDFALADRVMEAQGLDKHDVQAVGTAYFAQKWRSQGWQPDVIVATIQRVMARRSKPPSTVKYFEQAIADAHAELARPLPAGSPRAAGTGPPRRETFADLAMEFEQRRRTQTDDHHEHHHRDGDTIDG